MLVVDVSSFFSQFFNGIFDSLSLLINFYQSVIVFRIPGGVSITLWNIHVGLFIISVVFGTFIFLSPRFCQRGGV